MYNKSTFNNQSLRKSEIWEEFWLILNPAHSYSILIGYNKQSNQARKWKKIFERLTYTDKQRLKQWAAIRFNFKLSDIFKTGRKMHFISNKLSTTSVDRITRCFVYVFGNFPWSASGPIFPYDFCFAKTRRVEKGGLGWVRW